MGGAALAVAALAVRQFSSFSSAMSGVQAATQASASDMSALREAALQAGADTKYSATEAAQGIEALGRAGVSTRNVLGGGLKGALDLAAAGQMQVKDAAELASIAMTQFNLSGKDVPHVADLLAAGAGKAMGEVSDLGMALKQGGLVASQFGLSIEETVGTLSAFASAGLLGSDAGTSFKSMLQHLADPSKESARLMQQLGINAYDAQGKFVGLAGLAGQLREKLGHLTDAQRQQALAQIFGSDAIRAASILYAQGAEGIQQWTAAVNDSGYAARQAAQLQDNLAGDLEKLGGSWETLAIRMGESANGPLRAAVQALDGFLSALAQSPAAAAALMGVVTVFGAVALGAAALMRGAVHLAEFRSAMDQLGMAGGKLSKVPAVLGKVAKAAGLLGVAFAGVQLAAVLASWNEAAVKTGDELNRTLTNIGNGFTKIDSIFRSVDGKALTTDLFGAVEGIKDLGSALDAIDWDAKWGAGADHSWFGIIQSDAGKAVDALKQVSQQLTQMDAMQAGKSFGKIFEDFKAHGKDAAYTAQFFGDYLSKVKDQLVAAGPAYSDYANNMDKLAEVAGGKLPAGLVYTAEGIKTVEQAMAAGLAYTDHLGNSYDAAGQAAEQLGSQQQAAAAGAEAQAKAIKSVVDALNDYYSAVASAEDSAIKLEAAYDAAAEALEKNGRTLDITTEKGRANRSALLEIAEAAKKLASDMIAAGEGGEGPRAVHKDRPGNGHVRRRGGKIRRQIGANPRGYCHSHSIADGRGRPGEAGKDLRPDSKAARREANPTPGTIPGTDESRRAGMAFGPELEWNSGFQGGPGDLPGPAKYRREREGIEQFLAEYAARNAGRRLHSRPARGAHRNSRPRCSSARTARQQGHSGRRAGRGWCRPADRRRPASPERPAGQCGSTDLHPRVGQLCRECLRRARRARLHPPTDQPGHRDRRARPSCRERQRRDLCARSHPAARRRLHQCIQQCAVRCRGCRIRAGRNQWPDRHHVHPNRAHHRRRPVGHGNRRLCRRLCPRSAARRRRLPNPHRVACRRYCHRPRNAHLGFRARHALPPRVRGPGGGGGALRPAPAACTQRQAGAARPAARIRRRRSGRSGGSGTVTINVTMPETAATTGSAGVAWLEEFADRARRASWDRRY